MGTSSLYVQKDEQASLEERKLKLLLDRLHREEFDIYNELVKFLSERCQVTILKKKPLDLKQLIENDVFMLISPKKSWKECEVETVRRYVDSHGGVLVAMTDGVKKKRLNKALEPYNLSITRDTVSEKFVDRNSLKGSQLLEGVKLLALGSVWGYESPKIAASNEVDVVLQYKNAILGARRSLGEGAAYLFSCLPCFGNKQLKQAGNRIFLGNLIKFLAGSTTAATTEATSREEALAAQAITKVDVVEEAISRLSNASDKKKTEVAMELLKHSNYKIRAAVASATVKLAIETLGVWFELANRLADDYEEVQLEAAKALWQFEGGVEYAVRSLRDEFNAPAHMTREDALRGIDVLRRVASDKPAFEKLLRENWGDYCKVEKNKN